MNKIIRYIEANQAEIIQNISIESIAVYNFLRSEFKRGDITENYIFQFVYRKYFQIDNAGLTDAFKEKYFKLLQGNRDIKPFPIKEIALDLYSILNKRNLKNMQFSFITKMENIINEHSPIYDSEIARVFDYKPATEKNFEKKLNIYLERVDKIKNTYEEILQHHLLDSTINLFEVKFATQTLSDIKVLDFIFWSAGKLLKKNKHP